MWFRFLLNNYGVYHVQLPSHEAAVRMARDLKARSFYALWGRHMHFAYTSPLPPADPLTAGSALHLAIISLCFAAQHS